jgi:hypothetical protein
MIEMLELATRLYRSEVFIRNILLHEPLEHLLWRSIETLSPAERRSALPDLFALPIPQDSFFPADARRWPEPADAIIHDSLSSSAQTSPHEPRWQQIIPTLIRIVGDGKEEARRRALIRLVISRELGLLDSDDETTFARALWRPEHLDSYGFPKGHGLHDWVLMTLPQMEPEQAKQAFRRKYLEEISPTVPLNQRLWMVSRVIVNSGKIDGGFVFHEAEKALLFKLILEWSKERPSKERHPFLFFQEQSEAAYDLIEGASVILLHFEVPLEIAESVWQKVDYLQVVEPKETSGFRLLAAMVGLFPNRVDVLASRLLTGLVSDDQKTANGAALGLYEWLRARSFLLRDLPNPGEDLIDEVGFAIAGRRKSILANALALAHFIFTEGSQENRRSISMHCEHGLRCLLEETRYDREPNGLPMSTLPVLRRNCVRLAVAMQTVGFGEGEGTKGWIEAAPTDPLPEVRNALDSYETETRTSVPSGPEQES